MSKVVSIAYREYLSSPHWHRLRERRLREDFHSCTRCSAQSSLQVHHLTYDRLGCERLTDLVTLCRACHQKEHGRDPDLPAELPESFYRRLFMERMSVEVWEEVVGQAATLDSWLGELVKALWVGEDDPRVRAIRDNLAELMCEGRARFEARRAGAA